MDLPDPLFLQLVDTTVELANKVGAAEIISRIVDDLKDEAEQYRKMVMETIEKIMGNLGAADIDHKLEEQLIDGILYAFQEQTTEVRLQQGGANQGYGWCWWMLVVKTLWSFRTRSCSTVLGRWSTPWGRE